MRDYLTGYLDVIPQGEKRKVEEILRVNGSTVATTISEAEFAELIRRIAENNEQQTEVIEQKERVSSDLYNRFINNLQIDLNVMFAESQLIDQALGSYDRLYDGILADLSKEIRSLRERISSLHLVAEGEDGLIVKTFDFRDAAFNETDREQYGYLFRDRDGSTVEDAMVIRASDKSYLSLSRITSTDRIRDNSGRPVAQLAVIDQRGTPITKNIYPISNAIDDSPDSYWGEVVLVDQPITVGMDGSIGGALVKFTIVLPRPEVVSEIRLTPFTKYPLEIVSIKYEEDTETYHIPKELVGAKLEGTQTVICQFPKIIAKRFTFILKQANYTKDVYLVREKEISKADLWDKISKREAEVTLASGTTPSSNVVVDATVAEVDLNSWSGWDIYLTELKKYEAEYAIYMIEVQKYNAAYAQYQSALSSYRSQYGY